jgi:adenosyl cobinamide kinase/adenosyl cobinamide phosphate guanylyltransferase
MAINIILFSGKARHGKDSAAEILIKELITKL